MFNESDEARQRAREIAFRHLARRDRTVAEMERHLAARDVVPAAAAAVIDELLRDEYLDDARFARRFAEDRRSLDGWGAERIARRLGELGVDREEVAAALAPAEGDAERAGDGGGAPAPPLRARAAERAAEPGARARRARAQGL